MNIIAEIVRKLDQFIIPDLTNIILNYYKEDEIKVDYLFVILLPEYIKNNIRSFLSSYISIYGFRIDESLISKMILTYDEIECKKVNLNRAPLSRISKDDEDYNLYKKCIGKVNKKDYKELCDIIEDQGYSGICFRSNHFDINVIRAITYNKEDITIPTNYLYIQQTENLRVMFVSVEYDI